MEPACYQHFPGYPRWSTFDLSYTLVNIPEAARPALQSALQRWEQVSRFRFTERPYPLVSQLMIGFYRGDHGDGFRFGPGGGGELAHGFRPMDGRLHFDADQPWSFVYGPTGYDLESVAVHELGHVLGLDHSQFPRAVMYRRIRPGEIRRELSDDEILGLRVLYSGMG